MKIIIVLSITLLSIYTSKAQNIININSSSKGTSKNSKTTNDFINAKQSRELVLNEKVQANSEVRANDTILLDLFSNKQYKAYVDKVEVDVNGTLSIRARIKGYDYASCFITTFNGKSFITIDIPENQEYYVSRYSPETSTYYLLEMDKTKMKALEGSSPLIPPAENQNEIKKKNNSTILNNPITSNGENDLVTITVMVVYTPAAAAWSTANETNINNTISLMMQKANLAHNNSNTLVNLQLVHSQQIDYSELNSENDLYNLTNNNDGIMDNVHSLRNTYFADLVMLLEATNFTGGIGWVLNTPLGSPSYGFSLTRVQQASWTYTGVHEMGHNMGCGHHKDQTVQPGPGLYSYAAGGRWTGNDNGKYCSVMTYGSGSSFSDGITHTEVPYFSNPNILYKGVATGHPADADNARTIRQTKSAIANYRNSKSNQTITAPGWQSRTFGDADFNHNISASSGLPVTVVSSNPAIATIVGNKIHIVAAGSTTIIASQAGNNDFNAASNLNLLLTVNKASQTITFNPLTNRVYGDPDFEIDATSSSGLATTYLSSDPSIATIVGTKVHILSAGTVSITALQAGNLNYDIAPNKAQSLTINKAQQTISFSEIGFKNYIDPDFTLLASSSVGLPITYKSSNVNVATVSGDKIDIIAEGSTYITAMQTGNINYDAAPDVSRELMVGLVLPASNFSVQTTDETCKTSNNGSINITATEPLIYTSVITGNAKTSTQTFTSSMQVIGLDAGTYSICITAAGSSSYKQCFDVIIKEPKDLAVYSSVNKDGNTVLLKLEGSDLYTIELNGEVRTTTQQEITLPLIKGNNLVKISTNKICQGILERSFLTTSDILLYPNPVKDVLNVNLGRIETGLIKADIYALDGRLIHTSNQQVVYGKIALTLTQLPKGLYILKLTSKSEKTIHKFIKE